MINRLKTPALILGLAVMVLGAPASAQNIKVPKDFAAIQKAVDSTSAGDMLRCATLMGDRARLSSNP